MFQCSPERCDDRLQRSGPVGAAEAATLAKRSLHLDPLRTCGGIGWGSAAGLLPSPMEVLLGRLPQKILRFFLSAPVVT